MVIVRVDTPRDATLAYLSIKIAVLLLAHIF